MDIQSNREKKNKRIAGLTTIAVQLILFLIFYFVIAWREPNPPIPEYGIEIGFASSDETEENEEDSSNEIADTDLGNSEDIEDDAVDESENNTQETAQVEEVSEEVTEEKVEPIDNQNGVPISNEEEKINERALLNEKADEQENIEPTDESTQPKIDSRAIYGKKNKGNESSEGASLTMAGWTWDFEPSPEDESDESGKIMYRIVVDQDGYLVKIEPLVSTVSPAVERKYRKAVEKLTFSKTDGSQAATASTGTITFIITSR